MTDYRDVAAWCERCLTVSTIVTPHGNAKCDQNQVVLGAAMTRAADVLWREW